MLRQAAKAILPAAAWKYLRSKKINYQVKYFQHEIFEGNFGGHNLKLSLEDPMARLWYKKHWPRLKEIEVLSKSKLIEGAKVLDLGAHQSVVAMMLALEVGPAGRVLAIEANKHNYQVGLKNKQLNGIRNLEIVHCAVGSSNGPIEFSEDFNGAISSVKTTTRNVLVDAFTIDHFVKEYFVPDVIFMDVEGFEVEALKSASLAFSSNADWFIEVHGPELIGNYGGTVKDVTDHFTNGSFEILIADESLEFHEYSNSSHLLKDRFFLIALNKK